MNYKQHPLSSAFPAMQAEEFQSLRDSIEAIGVQNPITLLDGMVIDGWHRYSAANDLGMDCPAVELGDVDPRDFVLAQNKTRRHITAAQLAMAAVSVYKWQPAGRPPANNSALNAELHPDDASKQFRTECGIKKTGISAELKQPEIADRAGVSLRSLQQAAAVEKSAAPEVIDAVRDGSIGLVKAAAIARMPREDQAEAINRPIAKAPPPAPVQDDDEFTETDVLRDQVEDLQAALALANLGQIDPADKDQTAGLIAELRAEIKTLRASLKAVTTSRDSLMNELAQVKRQCISLTTKLKKAGA